MERSRDEMLENDLCIIEWDFSRISSRWPSEISTVFKVFGGRLWRDPFPFCNVAFVCDTSDIETLFSEDRGDPVDSCK